MTTLPFLHASRTNTQINTLLTVSLYHKNKRENGVYLNTSGPHNLHIFLRERNKVFMVLFRCKLAIALSIYLALRYQIEQRQDSLFVYAGVRAKYFLYRPLTIGCIDAL